MKHTPHYISGEAFKPLFITLAGISISEVNQTLSAASLLLSLIYSAVKIYKEIKRQKQ